MGRDLDIDALYAQHREGVLRFFARRTADPEVALDLLAETFAQAVASRGRCRARTDDERAAWLYAIVRRQLARYRRRGSAEQRAIHRVGLERPPVDAPLLDAVVRRTGLEALRTELSAALGTLGADTRRAVELRIVDELPYPEIAARLAITETAARARVSRGLQALGRTLDPRLVQELPAR